MLDTVSKEVLEKPFEPVFVGFDGTAAIDTERRRRRACGLPCAFGDRFDLDCLRIGDFVAAACQCQRIFDNLDHPLVGEFDLGDVFFFEIVS